MGRRTKLKEDKKRLSRMAQESISVEAFLARYLGIRDNSILSRDISHADIKALFPNLTRSSFDHVIDNPEIVSEGQVLLVTDCYGRTIPYFNPLYVLELSEPEDDFIGEFIEEEPQEEIIPDINELDLTSLSNYELQGLLHLYAKYNLRGAHRRVRKELTSRKDSRHASKESIGRKLKKSRKNERFDY